MRIGKLTELQESFAQEYVKGGPDVSASDAYRKSGYSWKNKTPKSVNEAASRLLKNGNVMARVQELKELAGKAVEKRFTTSIEEVAHELIAMMRFDPADLYDENGNLKSIHEIPKAARQMIAGLEVDELYEGRGDARISVGMSKRVKYASREGAMDKLLKYLGGYAKDNEQKTPEIRTEIDMSKLPTDVLRAFLNAAKPAE